MYTCNSNPQAWMLPSPLCPFSLPLCKHLQSYHIRLMTLQLTKSDCLSCCPFSSWTVSFTPCSPLSYLQARSETARRPRKLATAPAACISSNQMNQRGRCKPGVNRISTTEGGRLSSAGKMDQLTSSGTGITTRWWQPDFFHLASLFFCPFLL